MAAARRSRLRSRLRLVAWLLLLSVGSLEIVVRCAGLVDVGAGEATAHHAAYNDADMFVSVADPALSYVNKPHAVTVLDCIEYRHDERGRRVTPHPSGDAPAPGVAFLGDSTTYGFGLHASESLPARVAQELGGAFRPLNLSVCGYGISQEVALYEAESELLGDTPLVVLVVFPNDFVPGVFRWDSPLRMLYADPLPLPHAVKRVLWRSALYRMIASGEATRRRAQGQYDPHALPNIELALGSLERLAESVRADGRTLLVAHLPTLETLDPYEFEAAIAHLSARCARLGIPFVDLLDGFLAEREREIAAWEARTGQSAPEGPRRYFLSRYWLVDPHDHHPNAEAVAIAARVLAPRVRQLLETPDGR